MKRAMWSRILSLILALSLCLPIPATVLAAETVPGQVGVETTAGNVENVDVTITIEQTQNEDGTTSVQTGSQATDAVTGNGYVVDYSSDSNMLLDQEGNVLQGEAESNYTVEDPNSTYRAEGGSELSVTPVAPEVSVDVPLVDEDDPATEEIENQNTQSTTTPAGTVTEVTGDVKENDEDGEYDYTTTTVQKPGSVTVTTGELTITENTGTENRELTHVSSDALPNGENDLIHENASLAPEEYLGTDQGSIPEGGEGYEYVYEGTGNTSQLRPAVIFTEPLTAEEKVAKFGDDPYSGAYIYGGYYTNLFVNWLNEEYRATVARTEDGGYVTDEEGYILDIYGNRVLKEEKTVTGPDGETYYLCRFDNMSSSLNVEGWYQDGEWVSELNGDEKFGVVYATSQQFVLVDRNTGEVVTVYCADISTVTEKGFGYTVQNLEDAGYYTEAQAEMIRSVALNGYWGTEGVETDEEGNPIYQTDEAGNVVTDGEGNPVPVPKLGSLEALKQRLRTAVDEEGNRLFSDEEIDGSLTDGVALTATQMAIWFFSNKMDGTEFINTHYVGAPGDTETDKKGQAALGNVPVEKEDEVRLMMRLYDYLISLEPTSYEGSEDTSNTIINEKNFLENMSLTVLDRAEGHANNQDTDPDNDAYVTNISFALVVTPSAGNGDSLVVSVLDMEGNVIASGRIAGEAQEGETVLAPDEKGNYSFTGITLIEGKQNFHITLDGIQNLEEGVYLYTSEVRTDDAGDDVSSQTMVGLASGTRDVNISMNIEFDVSVEDEIIVKERVWRNEWEEPGNTPPGDPPEDPPKANPPKTGDATGLYAVLSTLSGMGLSVLQLFKRRKKAPAKKTRKEAPPASGEILQPCAQESLQEAPAQQVEREEAVSSCATVPEHSRKGGPPDAIVPAPQSGAKDNHPHRGAGIPEGGGPELLRHKRRKGTVPLRTLLWRRPPRPVLLQ